MERFLKYFEPREYELDLKVDKEAETISGEVLITGVSKAEKIKFHALRLKIEAVYLDDEEKEFVYQDGVIEILAGAGEHRILVKYSGKLNRNMEGAYLSSYKYEGRTEKIVATQFESHYAREAFPCIDEPEAKAVFKLSITLPEGAEDLVLANMPVLEKTRNRTVFEPTPRMSTYLLAWVIGRFHGRTVVNAHGTAITTYVTLSHDIRTVDFANEVATKSLEFYDDNFGVAYPLKKLDQVALPDFEAGAMENWGLVTYRESMLVVDENSAIETRKGVAITIAHELSHQWFGDLVTMAWWDDLWLNESFASVMEYFAVDYIFPEYHIFEDFFTGDTLAALKRDAYLGVQSVHQEVKDPAEISTLFDPAIVYAKGARLMLMVIRAMGWEKFCQGIRAYFKKYQYKNTKGDDLWAELQPFAEFNVQEMMYTFIDRPGYPVLMDIKDDKSSYRQKRFLIDGELKDSDYKLPKIREDLSGHYILNLSKEQLEERLTRFSKLGLEERLRILIDRSLITKTDLGSSKELIPLVWRFRNEDNAAVWGIIATIVNNLKIFFRFRTDEEREFKEFVGRLIRDKLSEIGLKTREGDDQNTVRLRAILLALDFYAENRENLRQLADLYDDDLGSLDAEIRGSILDAKIFLEPKMIEEYIEKYKKTVDPEIKFELLFATTLSRDEGVLRKMLELLKQPEVVKPQDQFYLFIYLYRNPVFTKTMMAWLKENWAYIKELAGEKSLENYPRYMANTIKTEEDEALYLDFFEPIEEEPVLRRAIMVGKNEIKARLKLIQEEKEGVYRAVVDTLNDPDM
ncbi:MAG: M1 family metallopeptidase [Candidatus Saccharibacteria bacterium]|nr:M1 family metallopeptidase [Candidatus Saccharibacteria bacterium]